MKDTRLESPNFNGKIFLNPVPTVVTRQGAFLKILRENFFDKNKHLREPPVCPGPFTPDLAKLNNLPPGTVRVTWIGHSTLILEIDGKRFLTDPVWAERVSPFNFIGPKRFFPAPIEIEELPHLDGIILSHDHYDHFDEEALKQLNKKNIPFFCPLGVGKRLEKLGVNTTHISEADWWDEIKLNEDFKLVATPARHFSGRWISDRFKTLWASWVIIGPEHKIYYGGDSGMFPGFKDIGDKYGPFDLTALEIGAANEDWEDIHMGPFKAADAHLMLKGKLMLPIHWGTFNLAHHAWEAPVEDLIPYAAEKNIQLLIPEPGQTIPAEGAFNSEWWKSCVL